MRDSKKRWAEEEGETGEGWGGRGGGEGAENKGERETRESEVRGDGRTEGKGL